MTDLITAATHPLCLSCNAKRPVYCGSCHVEMLYEVKTDPSVLDDNPPEDAGMGRLNAEMRRAAGEERAILEAELNSMRVALETSEDLRRQERTTAAHSCDLQMTDVWDDAHPDWLQVECGLCGRIGWVRGLPNGLHQAVAAACVASRAAEPKEKP